jgi:transcription initiation factor TFIIA small subunit
MDTLDELIGERRIEPQLAMKILSHFDRSITEVLQDKVWNRDTSTPTASAMKCGPS